MVERHALHAIAVSRQAAHHAGIHLHHSDQTVRAGDGQRLPRRAERHLVGAQWPGIHRGCCKSRFPDVPQVDDATGVTGGEDVARQAEGGVVAGGLVSMEGSGADTQPGVPHGDGFVSGAGEEEAGEGQEADAVDGGGVAAQCEAAALAVQVPQLGGSVSRAGSQEMTARVEGAAPGGLAMTGQRQHAAATTEIPEPHLQGED